MLGKLIPSELLCKLVQFAFTYIFFSGNEPEWTDEDFETEAVENGTTERQMRNQFHAWTKFMTMSLPSEDALEAAE